MLKSLWLRWQCWRNGVCFECGEDIFDTIHSAICDKCFNARVDVTVNRLSAAVRAMRGKSWGATPMIKATAPRMTYEWKAVLDDETMRFLKERIAEEKRWMLPCPWVLRITDEYLEFRSDAWHPIMGQGVIRFPREIVRVAEDSEFVIASAGGKP